MNLIHVGSVNDGSNSVKYVDRQDDTEHVVFLQTLPLEPYADICTDVIVSKMNEGRLGFLSWVEFTVPEKLADYIVENLTDRQFVARKNLSARSNYSVLYVVRHSLFSNF